MPKSCCFRQYSKFFSYIISGLIIFSFCINSSSAVVYAADATSNLVHHHRGSSDSCGGCYNTPIFHTHEGDDENGGECYEMVSHVHSSSCTKSGTCEKKPSSVSHESQYESYCQHHGNVTAHVYKVTYIHSAGDKCGSKTSQSSVTVHCPSCGGSNVYDMKYHSYSYHTCGKTTSTPDGYQLNCDKEEGSYIDGYSPDCGLNEGESYGNFSIFADTTEWTNSSITLSCSLDDYYGILRSDGYGVISFHTDDGNIISESGDSITISDNGTYYAQLSVNENLFDTSDAEVMISISNIDTTPPQFDSISYDAETPWLLSNTITISASDIQPNGSPGSGLSDAPFSFDGGLTWQSEATYECTNSQPVSVCIRDLVGNINTTAVDITNVDCDAPIVNFEATPKHWYTDSKEPIRYDFVATDDKSGLAPLPFSYDNGETWTDNSSHTYDEPGTYIIMVKDNVGNTATVSITCSKESRPKSDNKDKNGDGESGDGDGISGNDETEDINGDVPKDNPKSDKSNKPEAENINSTDNSSDEYDDYNPAERTDIYRSNHPDQIISDEFSSSSYTEQTDIYLEQPQASDTSDINHLLGTKQWLKKVFTSPVAKAVYITTGSLLSAILLALVFMLLYSGVCLYSFDGNSYKLIALCPIHRGTHGYHINVTASINDRAYSSRYKLRMGKIFVKLHKNELIYMHIEGRKLPMHIDYNSIIDI